MRHGHVTLALTGASGMPYGLRLLQCLLHTDTPVHLLISEAARVVLGMETDLQLPSKPSAMARRLLEACRLPDSAPLAVFGDRQWTAPVASGSGAPRQMVVCPCSMGTLSAIATGASDNLIERAADVVLKERGKLILVPRETPFSDIHLENMLRLSRMGTVILPANPGFYHQPKTVEALVDFVVARILDQLGAPQTLLPTWGERLSPTHGGGPAS